MKFNRQNAIDVLNKVCKEFIVGEDLSDTKPHLRYKIIKEYKQTCPFCNYPQWDVMFMYPIFWSDRTVTYKTMTVNIHNFIEVDEVIEFSKHIDTHHIKQFVSLNNLLIKTFNEND
jgi:hypothetical protein